ncbi:glycosyltransferase family 32 protein [Bombella saccharophila]|uniref:Uncharacterized protein n=1 Tax=Bombella saccharophila TaxID=2967338 RepID=A0ABT3W5N1_9PROT|nr:glycosyltransferase [Bombella saccharophila]MCX5614379.1 hypothetical protein [Bombella saccharophila]
MFVGYLGTYIASCDGMIVQRHLCSWFDKDEVKPLTEEELRERGYVRQDVASQRYVFRHEEKGFLSFGYDMSIEHVTGPGKSAIFQKIDPSILPDPVPERPLNAGIEKNIHQIGIGFGEPGTYPEVFRDNRAQLLHLNAEYEYFYWSDGGFFDIKKFILDHYSEEVYSYYQAIHPDYGAAKADLFRYLCIYAIGGVYVDLKTAIATPLSIITRPDDRFLVSHWWHAARQHPEVQHMTYGEYEQYYLICASGHPTMRRIIHQVMCLLRVYQPDMQGSGRHGTLLVTGPIVYSRMIEAYGNEGPIRHIHSLSNGVEYTTLDDKGGHEQHTGGRVHYASSSAPIVSDTSVL